MGLTGATPFVMNFISSELWHFINRSLPDGQKSWVFLASSLFRVDYALSLFPCFITSFFQILQTRYNAG